MKNIGLDYCALYMQLIDFGTEELLKYHETIEKYLHQEKSSIDSKFIKIKELEKGNEDYFHFLVDSLSEEYHNFDRYYPNSFRSAIIIQSYSFLEYHLKRICDLIHYKQNLKFHLHDLKGNSDIEKSKIYLTRTCNINFVNFNPEWDFINKVRLLRNTIVHTSGEFELKADELSKFIQKHNSLTVKDYEDQFNKKVDRTYEAMIIDEKLNLEFITQIKSFLVKLTKEVFKREK